MACVEAEIVFLIILVGYVLANTLLQYVFYVYLGNAETARSWKTQYKSIRSLGDTAWWLPLRRTQTKQRASQHWWFASINILTASSVAALTTELVVRGHSRMRFEGIRSYGICRFGLDLLCALAHQSVCEYYWHRLMHIPYFYKRFHKHHHYYKSPEPFDDMMIHPVEAAGYYFIMYSPPFVYKLHVWAFTAYVALLGAAGILDHSGVHVSVPNIYSSKDHDMHHLKFEVNFSFPFPYMDILHDTYDGSFLGRHYRSFKCS